MGSLCELNGPIEPVAFASGSEDASSFPPKDCCPFHVKLRCNWGQAGCLLEYTITISQMRLVKSFLSC